MKKCLMTLIVLVMTCVSAACFASYGTDLDTEAQYVDRFMAGKNYAKVAAFMDPQLAKNLTGEQYGSLFAKMNAELGKMVKKDLRAYELFDERHILHYALGFEKAPAMALDVAFRRTGGKITMLDFRILNLGTNTAETATQGKEK